MKIKIFITTNKLAKECNEKEKILYKLFSNHISDKKYLKLKDIAMGKAIKIPLPYTKILENMLLKEAKS